MRHRLAPLAAALAILAADRVTKVWIERNVSAWDIRSVIPGFLNIIHAENRGMAFSLLANAPESVRGFSLIGVAGIVLVFVALMFWRAAANLERWALALVMGGAVGNLWDRILRGSVTDFIDVYYGDWHWATFNVADSAITCGALLLGLHLLLTSSASTNTTTTASGGGSSQPGPVGSEGPL